MIRPRLRFSLLHLLLLITLLAVGLAVWQRHTAWQEAKAEFAELMQTRWGSRENQEAAQTLVTRYPTLAQQEGAMLWAAKYGDAETCRVFLASGADPNDHGPWHGEPAIMYAVMRHQPAIVQQLVDAQANVHVRMDQVMGVAAGSTILHEAAIQADLRCVEILLEAGADFDACTDNGRTVLHHAVAGGYPRLVEAIADRGAKYAADNEGLTPYGLAALLRNTSMHSRINSRNYDAIMELFAEEERRWRESHPEDLSLPSGFPLP